MKPIDRDEFLRRTKEAGISVRLRRELRYVPEDITDWSDRDFIVVTTRSGSEGVLVTPLGPGYMVPFRLQNRIANGFGRTEAIICDFCATWQRGTKSAVITFTKSRSTVSFLCCGDLLCSLHVRGKTSSAVLSRTQLRETIAPEARITRLQTRLETILHQVAG